jgi:hypothetical protein
MSKHDWELSRDAILLIVTGGILLMICAVIKGEEHRVPPPGWVGWLSPLEAPPGMRKLKVTAKYTQSIYKLNDTDTIDAVRISSLEEKWHTSGGMLGVPRKLWHSDKYYLIPGEIRHWVGTISVKNSLGYYQENRGIKREYPDGTRFDDVLSSGGIVFEHRSRRKVKGKWESSILYEDKQARPKGYTGLTSTCASCHNKAGTGGYAVGLVPGGDTVLSDPMDWKVARGVKGSR